MPRPVPTPKIASTPFFPPDLGVDFNLLRSWLGLPPGSWPPDHYTLLGFPPGDSDPAAVEPRVMRKMDLLRRNQLLHPELVTEGMNRLAQALITLTDPVGKSAYDAQLALPSQPVSALVSLPRPAIPPPQVARPAPVVVAEPVIEDDEPSDDVPDEPLDPMELTQEISLPAGSLVEPYEVVEEVRQSLFVVPFEEPTRPKPVEKIVDGIPVDPVVRPWPTPPSSRRWIYARLAIIRKAIHGWNRLRLILGDPHDPIDRPGRVLLLLEAASEVRPHLQSLIGVVGEVGQPGGIVAAVLKQSLLLDTIRRLLPEQRLALAIDWRRGQSELQREYARLRNVAKETRARAEGIQRLPAVIRWLRDFPELILVGLALFALFVALVRSILGR